MREVTKEEVDAYEIEHKQKVDMLLVAHNMLGSLHALNRAGNYEWDLDNFKKQYEESWKKLMEIATNKIYHYHWKEGKWYKIEEGGN